MRDLTGSREILRGKYEALYGEGDYEEKIKQHQKTMMGRYILFVAFLVFAIFYSVVSHGEKGEIQIEDGKMISVERPGRGEEPIVLNAKVWAMEGEMGISRERQILIYPKDSLRSEQNVIKEETKEARLERRILAAAGSLNQDTTSSTVVLPTKLDDGTELAWQHVEKKPSSLLFFVIFAVFFMIYKSRYEGIRREERAAKASIIGELPEFISKLVLLLSGGMVLMAAMEKIIGDRARMGRKKDGYFYNQLGNIYRKARETNAPIHEEFYQFARRSKVRELMRIAGILSDNVSKGSDLVVKLQREGEMLWFARKKQSEERGRLAETKMTLPLVILLLVLVMITISPALMEM